MSERLLFYVQHLLGIGHVVRASRIVRALVKSGFEVQIAYGGRPVAGIDWSGAKIVQLAAVTAGADGFGTLVDADGNPATEAFKQKRRAALLEHLSAFKPDVVLIEAYPFARRVMRFELLPLLQAARERSDPPLVVSSVRDILQEGRKPERIRESRELIEAYFDAVLVHGREDFAPLDLSFPEADKIGAKLHYTGWVGPGDSIASDAERFDVVVSAGGGAVGHALFEAALGARAGSAFSTGKWLMLSGPNLGEDQFQLLKSKLPGQVKLERFRANLPSILRNADVSVSQAGYNTMADVLSAGCRAVVVPYAEGGESEQLRRAQLLADRMQAVMVRECELSAQTLAGAINMAMELPLSPKMTAMNGAAQSAVIIRRLLGADR